MGRQARTSGSATIANGQTVSDVVDKSDSALIGLVIPSAFTGVALTFQVSDAKDGTFQALYDETNTLVSMTVAVSRSYNAPAALAPWPFFKCVSGSAEGAARAVKIVALS